MTLFGFNIHPLAVAGVACLVLGFLVGGLLGLGWWCAFFILTGISCFLLTANVAVGLISLLAAGGIFAGALSFELGRLQQGLESIQRFLGMQG